ncbi:hypothetical protein D3C72_2390310 [compost metagenome]
MELIDALVEHAGQGELDKMAAFRTTLVDGKLNCVKVPGERVAARRADFAEDLR